MNDLAARLLNMGEYYAAGFCETPERDRFYRYALAQARFYENVPLPDYNGGALYPRGALALPSASVVPGYSFTFNADLDGLRKKDSECADVFSRELSLSPRVSGPHTVGGNLYTHSIPNYGRVLREGLNEYRRRVGRLPEGDFRDGLYVLLDGIEALRARAVAHISASGAKPELIEALERVPFEPARTLYEALVCWNFIFYVDGADNPGRLDYELIKYYNGEDITGELREFFQNADDNGSWSGALGPDYNPLTLQCLIAIKGMRRPSLELRITKSMPDQIWRAAAEALETGCGQPALYCEENYQKALRERFPAIPESDLKEFNGGGCTETMLAGISNVGSLDAGVNLPLVFASVAEKSLGDCPRFEDFFERVVDESKKTIADVLNRVNEARRLRAAYRPQPVRTLLIDDCIDRGRDFNDGGARYAWSVINLAGLITVAESLIAIRYAVYEKKLVSAGDLLAGLGDDNPALRRALENAPHYGVDDERADGLASEYVNRILDAFEGVACYPSGCFLPSSIQFTTYGDAGKNVPATPDGRKAGAPLNDSMGAVHGRDVSGPTALLNSVSKLPLKRMLGTPVLNLRLEKAHISKALKPLARAFFDNGGMQMQISCVSHADMLAAIEHPEQYGNLIVRIGGYSEYFTRLSPELQATIIARTAH